MNISNFGRLVGAGLLAIGLYAIAPQASAQSLSATATMPDPETWAAMVAGFAAIAFIRRRGRA